MPVRPEKYGVVVDASVSAKWFFEEESSERAVLYLERLRKKELEVFVPDLFFDEIGNVVLKRVRRDEISLSTAREIVIHVLALPLEVYSSRLLVQSALDLCHGIDLSIYDAIYVVLASKLKVDFLTSDQKLVASCGSKMPWVKKL